MLESEFEQSFITSGHACFESELYTMNIPVVKIDYWLLESLHYLLGVVMGEKLMSLMSMVFSSTLGELTQITFALINASQWDGSYEWSQHTLWWKIENNENSILEFTYHVIHRFNRYLVRNKQKILWYHSTSLILWYHSTSLNDTIVPV